jgi:cysteine sulfinate desulfinase/cysteine desulfurase-like protein
MRKARPDYPSLTGHKFDAPRGASALYVRRKAPFSRLVYAGHQEGKRGGVT